MGGQASFTPTKISNILLNFLALIVRIKILIFQSNLSTVLSIQRYNRFIVIFMIHCYWPKKYIYFCKLISLL